MIADSDRYPVLLWIATIVVVSFLALWVATLFVHAVWRDADRRDAERDAKHAAKRRAAAERAEDRS